MPVAYNWGWIVVWDRTSSPQEQQEPAGSIITNNFFSTGRGLLLGTSQGMRGGLFLSYLDGGTGTTMGLFYQQQQQGLDSGLFSTNC